MKLIAFFLLLSVYKTFGFIESYKNLFLYDLSKFNVTEENCNNVMDNAKTYNLACFNYSVARMNSQIRPKPFFESYVERFYYKNKNEIDELFNEFLLSYEKFRELTDNYMFQSFSSWFFDFKKFIRNNRETIDYYTISLITDLIINFEELFKIHTDILEDPQIGKIYQISRYSTYKPDQCQNIYNDVSGLTCIIVSKNYYIMKYNGFMNNLLN